jgi:hypothetical protein
MLLAQSPSLVRQHAADTILDIVKSTNARQRFLCDQ